MKTLIAVAVTALILTGTAFATGSALDPRVPALQRQIRALTAKEAGLQAQVDQNAGVLNHEIDLSTCRFVYQTHFNYGVLNLFALMIGSDQVSDQTPNDGGACSRVGLSPPRFLSAQHSPFTTLVGLLASVSREAKR